MEPLHSFESVSNDWQLLQDQQKKATNRISNLVAKIFEHLKGPITTFGDFVASAEFPEFIKALVDQIRAVAAPFFSPFVQRASVVIDQAAAAISGYAVAGFGHLLGGIANVINLVKAREMLQKGIQLANQPLKSKQFEYARSLIRGAGRKIALNATALAGVAVGLMGSSSHLAALIQPATAAAVAPVITAGGLVAAPISMALSAYGGVVNIKKIRDSSAQQLLLCQERDRLNALKEQMGGQLPDELKEREEIVRFALAKAKEKRISNIAGLFANSLFMAASILTIAAIATGPGAAILGTIALVCLAVGAATLILTRIILAVMRAHAKPEEKPLPSKEMLAKAEKILSTDVAKYQEKKDVAEMSNGELLTFLIRGPKTHLAPEIVRESFLAGQQHYWAQAFG